MYDTDVDEEDDDYVTRLLEKNRAWVQKEVSELRKKIDNTVARLTEIENENVTLRKDREKLSQETHSMQIELASCKSSQHTMRCAVQTALLECATALGNASSQGGTMYFVDPLVQFHRPDTNMSEMPGTAPTTTTPANEATSVPLSPPENATTTSTPLPSTSATDGTDVSTVLLVPDRLPEQIFEPPP